MDTSPHPDPAREENALAIRAAWLYHAGGLTQSEVAQLLGVAPAKAHRLVARATRAGAVRVFVEGPIAGCMQLEDALARAFSLRFCRVVPCLEPDGIPFRSLGIAAAGMLVNQIESGRHRLIGVGHGRTLAAMVDHLPPVPANGARFVSLLGGLPRRISANPFDVIHRLAEKTGADAWLVPVPFFANTAADRAVLLAQRGVAEALDMAAEASLFLVGIGDVGDEAFLRGTGMVAAAEMAALRRAGAAGEVLGRYLDAEGRPIATSLHDRVIALDLETLRGREVIAVAGGPGKVVSLRAVLRSGVLSGVITDELTARRLVETHEARAATKGRETCTRKPRTSAPPSSRAGSAVAS